LPRFIRGWKTSRVWTEHVVDFSGKSADSLTKQDRKNLSSKTCLVYFPAITDEIWQQSSTRWLNAGIASLGGCLMLNTLEYPNEGKESSLSEVLETTGEHLKKYSLSPKAAVGILRRANKRGKSLPEKLQRALESLANQGTEIIPKE